MLVILQILFWVVVAAAAVVFLGLASYPLWLRFYISGVADLKRVWYNFWAKLEVNAALGLQTNNAMTDMAIRLTREHYEYLDGLYDHHLPFFQDGKRATYNDFTANPDEYLKTQYRHVGKDGIVKVGPPWNNYRTVREWFLTPNHRLALRNGAHTIPMTVQTDRFGMISLSDEDSPGAMSRTAYEARLAEVLNDPAKQLHPSEKWMLLVLDVAETADGYSVPVEMELDWLIGAPWEAQTMPGKDNIGVLLLSHLNAAIRKAMKELHALEVTGETVADAKAKSAIQSTLEPMIWEQLGYESDGSTRGNWSELIKGPSNKPLAILARYGMLVLRARVSDILLPKELKDQLKKPTEARAEMSKNLIEAEARRQVAEKDKATRELAGEGEKQFTIRVAEGRRASAKLDADGDRDRLVAWSNDGSTVDDNARLGRLGSQVSSDWRAGVSQAAAGKVIVTGGPGSAASTPDLTTLAATVATIIQSTGQGDKPAADDSPSEPPPA